MKLKDQLILREVAGQYVIVPTGKRVTEVTSIVYISASAAYLWDYMKDREFHQRGIGCQNYGALHPVSQRKGASADIERFLQTLADNNILDDGVLRGRTFVRIPQRGLKKLWPEGGLKRPKDKGGVARERGF